MNSKLVSALISICVALILVILGEWLYAKLAQNQLLTASHSDKTQTLLDEMPDIQLTRQTEESFADLSSRPLFIKGRKPVDEPASEEKQAVAPVVVKFDWLLNGVYTKTNKLSALFSRATLKVPKDNYRKIAVGDDLDGWKLAEIKKDRVILKQGEEEKELLLRKPKLKQLPPKDGNAVDPAAEPPPDPNAEPVPEPEAEPMPESEPVEENLENVENGQI